MGVSAGRRVSQWDQVASADAEAAVFASAPEPGAFTPGSLAGPIGMVIPALTALQPVLCRRPARLRLSTEPASASGRLSPGSRIR